ncbi:MAG: amidase family protein [Oscillospiraceae bacterium]|nr:amidase family protein [Oscillospiraceae bacterium]
MNPKHIAVDDTIMRVNMPVMSTTEIFRGYLSPIDAHVITLLEANDYTINSVPLSQNFGTDLSELPLQQVREVFKGDISACLVNDPFGSFKQLATKENLIFLQPSYASVSRYGLVQHVPSMDQIGILAKDISTAYELLSVIQSIDPKDGVMTERNTVSLTPNKLEARVAFDASLLNSTNDEYGELLNSIAKDLNAVDVKLIYFDISKQVMTILAAAELSHSINRYDGVRFGYRSADASNLEEIYEKSRSESFSIGMKLFGILGVFVLSQNNSKRYYEQAMKLRRMIKESLDYVKYDVILLPTEINGNNYTNLAIFSQAPLAGLASLTFSKGNCGIQLLAKPYHEQQLLETYNRIISKD